MQTAVNQVIYKSSQNIILGIWMKIVSVSLFVAMSSTIKLASHIPVGELTFFRSFFGLLPVIFWLACSNELSTAFYTGNILGHIGRGLFGTFAMFFNFYALTLLPLPETIVINYGEPLMLVILSALILHEKVYFYRWCAVIAGLIGVMIIVAPNLTVFDQTPIDLSLGLGALSALFGAFLAAVAMVLVRKLVFTEKTTTVVLYFMITSSVASLFTLPFGWVIPDLYHLVLLISAGLFGGVAQIFMTQAYRHAEASTVAPFEYTSIILGIISGFIFFGDVPTINTLVGGIIVIASGIFIIFREKKMKLQATT